MTICPEGYVSVSEAIEYAKPKMLDMVLEAIVGQHEFAPAFVTAAGMVEDIFFQRMLPHLRLFSGVGLTNFNFDKVPELGILGDQSLLLDMNRNFLPFYVTGHLAERQL